jgi:hypothetical protein
MIEQLNDIRSTDRDAQNAAYSALMAETERPVGWAYAAWDELLAMLRDPDNHQRAIGAQLLCNLAGSDPELRIVDAFPALLAVTRDARFVTARHCLQSLWKIGMAGTVQQRMVVDGMAARFAECGAERNGTLIRYDILVGLHQLYVAVGDATIRERALALIETEPDLKYRKKYAGVWKKNIEQRT